MTKQVSKLDSKNFFELRYLVNTGFLGEQVFKTRVSFEEVDCLLDEDVNSDEIEGLYYLLCYEDFCKRDIKLDNTQGFVDFYLKNHQANLKEQNSVKRIRKPN